jgi:predicted nucleic acid-binding protein
MMEKKNASLHRVYYLDTSVIVKLLVREKGTEVFTNYRKKEYVSSTLYATTFCFAEALGVLKSKYLHKEIDEEAYFTLSDVLSGFISKDNFIELVDVDISDSFIFDEVERIGKRNKLDVVDAYQIVTIKMDNSSRNDLKSEPILVTADSALAEAARKEGLRAWNCLTELAP